MNQVISFLAELDQLDNTAASRQDRIESLSDAYLQLALDTLEISEGAIFCLDPTKSHLYVESSINTYPKSEGIPVMPEEIGVIRQSSPIYLANLPESLKPLRDRMAREIQVARSEMWLPLQTDGELIGVIVFGPPSNEIEKPAWIDESLNIIANRVAAAMAHSRSLKEMRSAKLRLLLLSDATAQISKLLDVESIEKAAMNHVVTLFDSGTGYLMLLAPGTRRLEVRSHVRLDSDLPTNLEGSAIDLETPRDGMLVHSIIREVAVSGI